MRPDCRSRAPRRRPTFRRAPTACTRGSSCPSCPYLPTEGREAVPRAFRSRLQPPATRRKAARITGSVAPAANDADERLRGQRSRLDRPEPSTIRTPATGIPALAHRRDDELAAAGRGADLARGGGQLLQQHLGEEVVALVVHPPDHDGQRVEVSDASGTAVAGAVPSPGRPATVTPRRMRASRNARAASSGGERAGQPAGAIDDEGRQRGRLPTDEVRLPAGRPAPGVVERLVTEDPARHGANPATADRRGEAIEIGGGRESGRRTPSGRGRRPRWARSASPTP